MPFQNHRRLYKCFAGQLTKEDVEMYLSNLEQIGVLRLDAMTNGDMRLHSALPEPLQNECSLMPFQNHRRQ